MVEGTRFSFDVFLSHSSKDKAIVHWVAERLRADGLRVWLDDWEIQPGDSIPSKIEEGLERSRVLVLCMSAHSFGTEWAQLEANTFRFRDPLNKDRRFLPLRLDDAPIKGSLAQFLYIDWLPPNRDKEYPKLLEACRPAVIPTIDGAKAQRKTSRFDDQPTAAARSIRTTVWVLGSYGELNDSEKTITRKLVATLGSGLAARGIRFVSGRSDMLDDLAAHFRNVAMAMNPRGPLPIVLDGKLRQTDLATLFCDTIGGIPNLAIVIGGGVRRGRVAEECDAAEEAGIPILPVPLTGGAAARVRLTAHMAADLCGALEKTAPDPIDTNDVVSALLKAVERYAP